MAVIDRSLFNGILFLLFALSRRSFLSFVFTFISFNRAILWDNADRGSIPCLIRKKIVWVSHPQVSEEIWGGQGQSTKLQWRILTLTWESEDSSNRNVIDPVRALNASERAIPDMIQAAGASTSISRTCMMPQNYSKETTQHNYTAISQSFSHHDSRKVHRCDNIENCKWTCIR